MSFPTLLTRRARIAGVGTAALLSLSLQSAVGRVAEAERSNGMHANGLPDSLVLAMSYGGVGAEGVDLIWRGATAAPLAGQATVRMAYAGAPDDRAMPIWPVTALLFFSADDYRSSFIAELSGTMNWQRGEMRVAGLVTDGTVVNTRVEQVLRLRDGKENGSLTLRFIPGSPRAVAGLTTED